MGFPGNSYVSGTYVEVQLRLFSRPRSVTAETCQRTLQCRLFLTPGPRLNARIVGALAKAQELFPVRVHAFVALSSHIHLLASFDDAEQMARFHNHFVGNLSKEAGRIRDWTGTMFPEPYHHVELSREPEVELQRLRYVLSQGCKEGLVWSPLDWPGASSTESLISGEPMLGEWVDRTALCHARHRGKEVSEQDFTEQLELRLEPLPSQAHRSQQEYRSLVAEMVRDIEKETAARHPLEGTCPLGVAAILAQDPHHRPGDIKKSPRPWFHALSREAREAMRTALLLIIAAYRQAADRLKQGDRRVDFPLHTFPPGLPFMRKVEILEPG